MSGSLISSYGQTLSVTRYAAGSYSGGTFSNGASSTFDIVMVIQPLSEKELLALPEGERTRRQMKGYTITKLNTVDLATGARADRITYDGTTFEVQGVSRWEGDLPHYKIRCAEVNE